MARDPTKDYFAGNDRDRAAFEAGIKLGSIYHQFIGAPLTRETARDLERAIEAGTRVQPLVEDVRVRIDRTRLHGRGPYKY
ncbi:MAG: dihydroneopterin aldolase family protein, partial [Candidatus Thermoplasmatota archaeon]